MDPKEQEEKKRAVAAGLIHPAEDETDIIMKIPNKILVTPYHVSYHEVSNGTLYKNIFALSRELFDPKFPYKQSREVKSRLKMNTLSIFS